MDIHQHKFCLNFNLFGTLCELYKKLGSRERFIAHFATNNKKIAYLLPLILLLIEKDSKYFL